MLQYKGHDKINNDRTSESEKRKINKVHSNGCGSYSKQIAKPLAYTKGFVFKPTDNSFYHITKIQNLYFNIFRIKR